MGADPSSYRDEIPHSSLLASTARRASDGRRLGRTEACLEMAAEEDYGHSGKCCRNRAACSKAHQPLPRQATSICATSSCAGRRWATPSAVERAMYAGAWFATRPRRKLSGRRSSGSWSACGCWHGLRGSLRTVAGGTDQVPRVARGVRLSSNHVRGASAARSAC